MRFLIKFTAIILVLVTLMYTAGTLLPQQHTVSRSIILHKTPDAIWQVITDYVAMPQWTPHIHAVAKAGKKRWRIEDKRGHYMVVEIAEIQPPKKMVSRIIETDYPVDGEWIFTLQGTDSGGTVLTITENGTIPNPLIRVLCRYIAGYDKGIRIYQEALEGTLSAAE